MHDPRHADGRGASRGLAFHAQHLTPAAILLARREPVQNNDLLLRAAVPAVGGARGGTHGQDGR